MLLKKLRNNDRDKGCKRCPSAEYKCICWVENYEFSFGKKSRDRSGKCNITPTNGNENKVYGVLFSILEKERDNLTKCEGARVPRAGGYKIIPDFVVNTEKTDEFPDGKIKAVTYIAEGEDTGDKNIEPYDWYQDQVVKGAEDYELPPWYIEKIKNNFRAKQDLDTDRAEKERSFLI